MDNENEKKEILEDLPDRLPAGEVPSPPVTAPEDPEIADLSGRLDLDEFQVVRREFFAHTFEPSAVFSGCKFYVNSACLRKFPEANAVQVLINRETRILALLPCPESAKDSFVWCSEKNGKRKPKQVTCKMFFAKIMDLMEWNPDHRYKILGKMIKANGETLIAFDLTAAETYRRTVSDTGKTRTSRTPVFPAEWQNQFGLPYGEHKKTMQIDIFDGYAVYSLRDMAEPAPEQPPAVELPPENGTTIQEEVSP